MPEVRPADPPRHGATRRTPEVVKSAVRVLEILEFFDGIRGPACVGLVAQGLGYPTSSTSALLRSLAKVGYLSYDPRARTYLPTERVPLLGSWVGKPLLQPGPLLELVETLAWRTGLAVVLARRTGCNVQYVHVAALDGNGPAGLRIGAQLALDRCAAGLVLLAALREEELGRLLRRLNAEASPAEAVRPAEISSRLSTVRGSGLALMTDRLATVLATRLPAAAGGARLVLGLAGTEAAIIPREQALTATLREEIARLSHLAADPRPRANVLAQANRRSALHVVG